MKRFYSLFQPYFSAHIVAVQAVLAGFKVLSFFFLFLISPSVFAFNLHGNSFKGELMFPSQETNQALCIDQGDISGVIVNQQSGKPISGVPVVLSSVGENDVPKLITVTGADGRYFFEGLNFGKYLIQVQDANLNVVRGLFASETSEVQVNLEECAVDVSDFVYGSNNPLFLSGRVWYDANGNGVQDEWFDANDDGRVTLNDLSNGAVEINKWEWFDLNGDGRYDGPENYGELNIAGFGNTQSSNIKVKSAEGPSYEAMIDLTGYWSKTFDHNTAFGNYSASLEMDSFLNEAAKNVGETGLIKTLPNLRIEDFNNIRMDIQCGLTTSDLLERELSRSVGHHSDILFGVRCREELVEIIANDDEIGEHFSSTLEPLGNILDNDVIKGNPVDPEKVEVEFTELDGLIGLNINEKGELILLIPGINPPGTYQLEYVLRENGFPDTFDKATVTVTLLADNVDLAIEKTSNDVEIFEGDEFEYTITVTNLGGTNASNVEIIDFFNSGLTYINTTFIATDESVKLDTTVEGNKIVYTVPELPAGVILTLTVLVQADAISGQNPLTISNQATVSSAEEDLDMSNNTAADFNVVNPFFIPNVITPNGDNKNDAFEIRGISKFTANNILIYNRYGDHVYERANYDNNWDAPNQVAGTYYYIFQGEDAGGKTHEFKGWVQVIKD
ncbi:gliding motility-associated C-terminal domain-containing protein [Mongoliibacter ruber]|uniref:Putative repeat protein (TIGR01451 family)/gliding motility-associated-like protein n=1 Tax=Mongoliibacter ruber TaxID=1750599 RepID=A0A2T0WST9_9BACT|nr:gliding motility-associated C-terminal domain-containing protein [Mongoliibacter ruber]PRY89624.1 putative repeat protein (TIGR01451 family)/gliding motility-associated-like protein [Mongoliibacter ruber]